MASSDILADNPFAKLESSEPEGHALALAIAFVTARDVDQLCAVCRYERRMTEGGIALHAYLDGAHFERFNLFDSDADGIAQNGFVKCQDFARAYLGEE